MAMLGKKGRKKWPLFGMAAGAVLLLTVLAVVSGGAGKPEPQEEAPESTFPGSVKQEPYYEEGNGGEPGPEEVDGTAGKESAAEIGGGEADGEDPAWNRKDSRPGTDRTDGSESEQEASYGSGATAVLAGGAPEAGRICEYSGIRLPECLKRGDYIDLRISYSDGSDYTILSGKRVEECRAGQSDGLLRLVLSEEELLLLSGARTDARIFPDTDLYAVICIDPEKDGYQINYPAGKAVRNLLLSSPNVRNTLSYQENNELDERRKEKSSSQESIIIKDPVQYWMEREEE